MRRFENEDEKKFWQIEITTSDRSTVKWSFGKQGSKGQTKLKKCATEAEATSELERLVAEKRKQGFIETTSSSPSATPPTATPAPAPAPAPVPAPAAKVRATELTPFAERVVATEAAARLDKSRAGVNTPPLPSLDIALSFLKRGYGAMKEDWHLALMKWQTAGTDSLRLALEEYIGNAKEDLNVEKEAMLATLSRHDIRPAVVARWLASPDGVLTAFDILSKMWGFYYANDQVGGTRRQSWLELRNAADNWDSTVSSAKVDIADLLERHVQALPANERAMIKAHVAKLRSDAPLTIRIGLARATGDGDFANEDTRALFAAGGTPPLGAHDAKVLMRFVTDIELLETLVDYFGFEYQSFRPEAVTRNIGLPSAKLLGVLLAKAGSRSYEMDVATYLATLESAETARILAPHVGKKGLAAIATEFFHRRPDFAIQVLGAELASRKNAMVLEPFLKSVLVTNSALFESLSRKLDPRTAAALRGLGALPEEPANQQVAGEDDEDAEAGELATAAEIPAVLADPPWLTKPTKPTKPTTTTAAAAKAPTIEGLLPLTYDDAVILTKEERAIAIEPPVKMNLHGLQARTPPMDKAALSHLLMARRHISGWIDLLSDGAALRYFAEDARVNAKDILVEPRDVLYLLARFGHHALPFIFALGKHSAPRQVMEALIVVDSPRVGVFAGERTKDKAGRRPAMAYLEERPEASAIGLIPAAFKKATQKATLEGLQTLYAQKPDVVRDVASRYGEEVEAQIDRLLEWQGPTRAGGQQKMFTPPAWFDPRTLPPVALRANTNKRIPNDAVTHLATLLSLGEPEHPHPRLDDVKKACTPKSLARWSWAVFQGWLANGADPNDDWVMTGLGELGDDDVARRMTPLIRAWPGESLHARAVKGLDVLARIGSDVALTNLDAIAEKIKFKALQERAREKINDIAIGRNLSRDELADRIAPTLDLDPDGSRVLSLGNDRSFRVGFDENLTPFVISAVEEDGGKRSADLPKARATDDKGLAAEAAQTWKALKKDAKAIAQTQILRLERAMIMQRRWTGAQLKTFFIAHPLIVHLTRRLCWAVFDDRKKLIIESLFRVAEDRSLANRDDDPFVLPDDAVVGLPHRLEMSDEDARHWGELFGNYEIVQPFPQLGREVFTRTAEEENEPRVIRRVADVEVSTRRVLGLTSRGWSLGSVQDAGWIHTVDKPLPSCTASLSLEGGLYVPNMAESPPTQKLHLIQFYGAPSNTTPISPILFSELARDLEWLRSGDTQ